MLCRALSAQTSVLAEQRQVRVVVSTEEIGRDNIVMMTAGIDLAPYLRNPVVLWQHDPGRPVARAISLAAEGDRLVALVQFPESGVSATADEVYGLIRAGIVNAASIGADPLETEPLGGGGERITRAEMCEFSFVSIPAVRSALVTERAAPVAAPESRPAMHAPLVRSLLRRGLYEVGQLAQMLSALGWIKADAEQEAIWEEDASKVPSMLGAALKQLADALLAMTAEEVAELLAQAEVDTAAPVPAIEDSAYVEAAAGPALRRFRAGRAALRRALAMPRLTRSPARQALLAERLRRIGG